MGHCHFLEKISRAPLSSKSKLDRWKYVATSLFMSNQGHDTLKWLSNVKQLRETLKNGEWSLLRKSLLCYQRDRYIWDCASTLLLSFSQGHDVLKADDTEFFLLEWEAKKCGMVIFENISSAPKKRRGFGKVILCGQSLLQWPPIPPRGMASFCQGDWNDSHERKVFKNDVICSDVLNYSNSNCLTLEHTYKKSVLKMGNWRKATD